MCAKSTSRIRSHRITSGPSTRTVIVLAVLAQDDPFGDTGSDSPSVSTLIGCQVAQYLGECYDVCTRRIGTATTLEALRCVGGDATRVNQGSCRAKLRARTGKEAWAEVDPGCGGQCCSA